MLSKGSVAFLPAVLLLLVWWRRGTIRRTDVWRTVPFFIVAVALTLLNIWFQSRTMPHGIREATLIERVLGAGAVVWFYLYKALWPVNLIFIYPQWAIHSEDARWWLPLAAAVAVTALLIWQRRRPPGRTLLFAWLFYGLALVPVMGLTDVYFMKYSLVADHYQYIAIIGVVACVAAGLTELSARIPGRLDARLAGAVLVTALGVSTWRQTPQYANGTTIYRSTLSRNPAAWMAHNNLALSYLHGSAADFQEAVAHLRAALAINPKEPSLHHNLGITLFQMDHFEEAAEQHREAVRLQPDYADAYSALGADYQKLGRNADAVESYRQALRLQPQMTSIRSSLALVLDALGRHDEASRELQQGLEHEAGTVQEHGAKGDALLRLGRTEEAISQYTEALRLDPNSAHTMNNLGYALMVAGRLDEAERQLRQALRLRPEDAAAHDNLGNVLQQMQRLEEAVPEFTAALKTASPVDLAEVHNDLGVVLAKLGKRDEAIAHFREALRRKPDFAAAQANLAKATRR
jgi:Flp pilus assembly protein TadD